MATPITGYRNLTEEEIGFINQVKAEGERVREFMECLEQRTEVDPRWLAIATTDLQKGFMMLTRAIAKPENF